MADEIFPLAGSRGRHRQPSTLGRGIRRMAAAVRNLGALSRRWRFFSEPFEVLLATFSIVGGAPAALGSPPVSLALQASPWLVRGWGVLLCVGGAAVLAARWRIGRWDPQHGTDAALVAASRLEVFGLVLLAGAVVAYAVAIAALGLVAFQAAAFTAAYGAAFALRAWIVWRQLTDFEKIRRRDSFDG